MTEFLKNLTLDAILPVMLMLIVGTLAMKVILRLVKKSLARTRLRRLPPA